MRLAAPVGALLLLSVRTATAQGPTTAPTSPPPPVPVPSGAAPLPPAPQIPPTSITPPPIASELAGKRPREVRFRGNTRLSSTELRGFIGTRAGEPIDPAQPDRDLPTLQQQDHRR